MSEFIPKPRRVPVGTAAAPIDIASDLYMTIVNIGWSPMFINLTGHVATVDRGPGDNIEIPPNGIIPNVPPLGITRISGISDQIVGFVLLTFSREPQLVPVLAPDNPRVVDDFDLLCTGDPAEQTYDMATFVALGGHRGMTVVVECLAQDGIIAFDGELPAVGPPVVGRQLTVGSTFAMDINIFVQIRQINAALGNNTRMRGWVLGD